METLAERYDLFVFDLDGVVYVGSDAVVGAARAIGRLHERRLPVAYATNNASRRAPAVAELLTGLGIPASAPEVVTSAQATAAVLAQRLPAGGRVLVVGADALAAELSDVGLSPVTSAADAPLAVAQGFGPQVSWVQLAEATVAIRAGALWVATNPDRTLPSPRGPLPGNGALVAALSTAVDRVPDLVIGKPGNALFEQAVRERGATRPLVIGDRLDTDIEGANRAGMDSLLVLTGVARPLDVVAAVPGQRPTYLAADLDGLFDRAAAVPVRDVGAGRDVCREPDGTLVAGGGDADPMGTLRALCAAAWEAGVAPAAGGTTVRIVPDGDAAAQALRTLGIVRDATAASGV